MLLRTLSVLLILTAGVATTQAADLTIGLAVEPDLLDPHVHNFGGNRTVMPHLFEGLTSVDPHDHMIPNLAMSWKPIDRVEIVSPTTIRFHTRAPSTGMLEGGADDRRPGGVRGR